MDHLPPSDFIRRHVLLDDPNFHVYSFEKFDHISAYEFLESYGDLLACIGIAVYLLLIWGGQKYMKNREPFDLRLLLVGWNVFVALVSFLNAVRAAAEVRHVVQAHGLHSSFCHRAELHVSSIFHMTAAILLKVAMGLDTVFLIVRKKHVDAAHVAHHILGGVFAAKLGLYAEPICGWVGIANAFTISVDYSLMALTAMKLPVPKSRHIMVALEVALMLFIIALSGYTLVQRALDIDCMRHPHSIALANVTAVVILCLVVANAASPDYWKRDEKRFVSRGIPEPSLKKKE